MALLHHIRPSQLRLLLKIAEVGQLQVAASALAMSQPAASRILAEIEARAEAKLFKRTPKGMEPTLIGQAFARHARVILSELENLEKEVGNLGAGLAGDVRIGSVTGPAVAILIPTLEALAERAPDVAVTVEVGPSVELLRGLDEGRFDFIMARMMPHQDSQELMVQPARSEKVSLLVREGHPLSGQGQVPLSALCDQSWAIQERGSPIREAVETAFHQAGLPVPRRVLNTSSLLVVQSLLSRSDVIVPQSNEVAELLTGDSFGAKLQILETEARMVVSPYFVIRNRGRQLPSAAQMVYDMVISQL